MLKPNGKHAWNAAGVESESTGREMTASVEKKCSAVAEIWRREELSVAADMRQSSAISTDWPYSFKFMSSIANKDISTYLSFMVFLWHSVQP